MWRAAWCCPRLRLVPGLRDKVVDSTTPALHASALVCKSRRPRRLAGTLCPNPLLPDGRRLDDVLGTGFALITTSRPAAADDASLRRRGVVVLVADRGAHSRRGCAGDARRPRSCGPTERSRARDATSLRCARGSATVLPAPVKGSRRRRRRPGDDHRYPDGVQDCVADRAQQHAGQTAPAVTAHDDKLSGFRLFDELSRRPIAHDQSVHRHVGIAFLPARQTFGETALRCRFHRRPVQLRKLARRDVAPCVQGDQIDAATRRFVERDRRREFRSRRAVDPHQDGSVLASGASSSRMTATGQFACRTTVELTEPSTPRASSPRPELPTTIISASSDILTRAGAGVEYTNSLLDGDLPVCRHRLFGDLDRVHDVLAALVFQPHRQRLRVRNRWPGRGGGDHRVDHGQRNVLSLPRHGPPRRAAASDAGEPSTATTMPRCLMGADISFSLRHLRRYKPADHRSWGFSPQRSGQRTFAEPVSGCCNRTVTR